MKDGHSEDVQIKKSAAISRVLYIPLHFSAPEDVFLLIHVDGEVLVLALLDGIRPGGDGPHLVKLREKGNEETY